MDPASASDLRYVLSHSNSCIDHQEEQVAASNRAVQALVSQVSELTTQLQRIQTESVQQPTSSYPPVSSIPDQAACFTETCLPPPAFYSGEPQQWGFYSGEPQQGYFLAKCSLYISLQPLSFPTEESKIAFVITLLFGWAALWGTTVWEQKLPCCTSFLSFSEEIKKVFDRAVSGREVARFLAGVMAGKSERHRLLHWIPHPGDGVLLEFRSPVGYVFTWTGCIYQRQDLLTGVTYIAGWLSQSGYSGGYQIVAERSTTVPSSGSQSAEPPSSHRLRCGCHVLWTGSHPDGQILSFSGGLA